MEHQDEGADGGGQDEDGQDGSGSGWRRHRLHRLPKKIPLSPLVNMFLPDGGGRTLTVPVKTQQSDSEVYIILTADADERV